MFNLSSDLLNSVRGILDEIISTPEEKREAEFKLKELDMRELEARAKVQSDWLSNKSFFVAGAIPSMLWMLVIVIFFNFILSPILMGVFGITIPVLDLPDWYSSMCSTIVLGLFAKKAWDSSDFTVGNMTKHAKNEFNVKPQEYQDHQEHCEVQEEVQIVTETKKNNNKSPKKVAPTTPATKGMVADYNNPDYINARLKELTRQ